MSLSGEVGVGASGRAEVEVGVGGGLVREENEYIHNEEIMKRMNTYIMKR